MTKEKRENKTAFYFILPAIIIMILVHLIPITLGTYISFLKLNASNLSKFLKAPLTINNFIEILSNKHAVGNDFLHSLKNILIFGLTVVPVSFIIAYAVALFLNQKIYGKTFIIGIILLPYFTMDSVAYITWNFLFRSDFNILNGILKSLGIIKTNIIWLAGNKTLIPVIISTIWKTWSFSCIILLAGLQTIPEDLYEAAKIDGAGWWKTFKYITFPMLWPLSKVLLLLSSIWIIHSYNNFLIMTGGNDTKHSIIPSILITRHLNFFLNYGIGSAMAVILLIIVFIITVVLLLNTKDKTYEI